MEEAREVGRRIAFGRFVKRATDQWLDEHPEQGMRELADYLGSSTPTIYRWINGDWKKDPHPDKVDMFCDRLHIDPKIAHEILGWGVKAPARPPAQPADEEVVEALARKLRNPNVPHAEKQKIRELVRFVLGQPGTSSSDDTRDTGT